MATINLKDENPINVNISNEKTLNTNIKDLNYIPEYKKYEAERQLNEAARINNEITRQANEVERENYINSFKEDVESGVFKGDPGESASVSVGTIETGEPGTNASVTNSGTDTNVVLDFVIPRGDKGESSGEVYIGSPASSSDVSKLIIEPVKSFAEGESISLTDASNNLINSLKIEGKSTQKTRSGKNLLSIDKTSTTINGITFTINEDKSITINGTSTADIYFTLNSSNHIFLKENETYTSYLKGNNGLLRMITRASSVNKIYLTTNYEEINNQNVSVNVETFTFLNIASGVTFDNLTLYPMIVEGSYTLDTIGEFEQYGVSPSPDYPSEIESVGYENLLNWNDIYYGDNVTATYSKQEVNFSWTGGFNLYLLNNNNKDIELNKNKTYTLSFEHKGDAITLRDGIAVKTFTSTETNSEFKKYYYTFTNYEKIQLNVIRKISGNGTAIIKNVQIEEGSQSHYYIPYGKYGIELKITNGTDTNTTLFSLDEPLRSLPNGIKDIAYIKNNILYVDRYVGSVVLNGGESNWINSSPLNNDTTMWFQLKTSLPNAKKINALSRLSLISDRFDTYNCYDASNTKEGICYHTDKLVQIRIEKSRLSTQNAVGFKTWLSEHNTQVDYELATPITETIWEVEMPRTYEGVSNITNSENANMEVNYTKNKVNLYYKKDGNINPIALS